MFLGVYRFKGEADALLAAYDRLMASMPGENLELHVCTQTAEGIAVFDACPTKAAFEAFANSDTLREGFAAAGLPSPGLRSSISARCTPCSGRASACVEMAAG